MAGPSLARCITLNTERFDTYPVNRLEVSGVASKHRQLIFEGSGRNLLVGIDQHDAREQRSLTARYASRRGCSDQRESC